MVYKISRFHISYLGTIAALGPEFEPELLKESSMTGTKF